MKQNRDSGRFSRTKLALSVTTALAFNLAGLNYAHAQDDEEDAAGEVQEIQVTGSRISQRGNYTAPNPVVSMNQEDLQRLGINNMSEALTTQISQNISNFQPGMTGDLVSLSSSFFVGATLANLRGLNDTGNFGSRTLTLINGRRVVSSSNMSDVVDMNIIPSNMLARMDVVTGGASAAYGSGAMAGVVNLQLNTQMEGVNLDVDYGVTDKNDGENYHVALSAGTSLMDGRAHIMAGGEWQEQKAIRSCADARDWCGEGRGMLSNNSNFVFTPDPTNAINPYPQYAGLPANFRASNLRYNQFSSNGVIPVVNNANATQGWRFTPDGTDVEQYGLGVRGGASGPGGQVINGDGPPRGTGSGLTSGNERLSLYSRFSYDFSENLEGYVEGSYATTEALNVQFPTQSWSCVKFDQASTPSQVGASIPAGAGVTYGQDAILNDPAFGAFGVGWVWQPGNATYNPGNFTWTLNVPYNAADVAAVPAQRGPDENAYLNTLSPEAITQLQNASNANNGGNVMGSSSGSAAQQALGCQGMSAVYKLWAPQLVQTTSRESDTARVVFGLKGNFGETWSWDAYYQYGKTESSSFQSGAQTNWRHAFALDSIIDPRASSPTFGQPVCRVTVQGLPATQANGDPFSPDLMPLAEGCLPINPFGTNTADQAALDYAYRPLISDGENTLGHL